MIKKKTRKSTITFGFVLGSKPRKNGMYAVVFRITQNRKCTKVNTPLEVRKQDWNQKAKDHKHFRSSCLNSKVNNEKLQLILEEYKSKYVKLDAQGKASAEKVLDEVEEKEISFLNYAKKVAREIADAGRYRDYKKHHSFIRKLEAFLDKKKKKDLLFTDIKLSLLRDFDNFLHTLPNERNPEQYLHQNSIAELFKIFKRVLNKAIKIDGLMKVDDNPFLKTNSFTKEKKTLKEGLDESEITRIKSLELEEGTLVWHARNAFLFSYYCRGIRSGDLLELRWNNIVNGGQRLHYIMSKSNKEITNELVEPAKDILTLYNKVGKSGIDYIFPFLDGTKPWAKYTRQEDKDKLPTKIKEQMYRHIDSGRSKMNNNLKKIAKLANISKPLSTHVARHSFAQLCVSEKVDSFTLQTMLGHTKQETTRKYCGAFDSRSVDTELNRVFEKSSKKVDNPQEVLVEQLKNLSPEQLASVFAQAFQR